ncbi:MAG: hypothetical protein M3N12_10890 [Verrucomicrobiota bacterium]|nr:hypothetical protein [Verrucomicrobiota bacterium]
MKRYVLVFSLLLAASVPAPGAPTLDESARFLAGLPVEGALKPLTQSEAWLKHANAMEDAWHKKEYFQLGPIRAWMAANASA